MGEAELVYGHHAVAALLAQRPAAVKKLLVAEGANKSQLDALIASSEAAGVAVQHVPRRELDALAPDARHQGVIAVIRADAWLRSEKTLPDFINSLDEPALLLVLDGVQDPHNLGACLRTADACGVDAVIIPRDRAVKVNATVRKVAAGGAESVPVIEVTNIARSLKDLQQAGVWVFGTSDSAANSLYEHDFSGPVALVMGAEGSGLRRLTMESCDHLFKLPMHGQVESLNVSVATGVCLYEILRSRSACGRA